MREQSLTTTAAGVQAEMTIGGGETPRDDMPSRAPLSGAQREILLWLREHRSIRSVQAGVIVHAHRAHPCPQPRKGEACCRWSSSDGNDTLKRLAGRGLVARAGAGVWTRGQTMRDELSRLAAQLDHSQESDGRSPAGGTT